MYKIWEENPSKFESLTVVAGNKNTPNNHAELIQSSAKKREKKKKDYRHSAQTQSVKTFSLNRI